MVSFPLSAGEYLLKWSYEKDEIVPEFSDCVWIDDLELNNAGVWGSSINGENADKSMSLFGCYPNPFNNSAIKWSYEKDEIVPEFSDCVWIDDLELNNAGGWVS